MKEIFIHVGAGKTGTSAIQEFLCLNERTLEREGLHLPGTGREKSNKFIFHHDLAGGREQYMDDSSTIMLWEEISKLQYRKILITSEIFHSRVKRAETKNLFFTIKNLLKSFDVKIIFYIRRDEQWIQSAYEEWIKSGTKRDGESIHEFVKRPMTSLAEQVLLFAEIFGKENIIVRPFEKEQFVNSNIYDDFFDILGIELHDGYKYPSKNSNPRLSVDALEFKRIFNTACKNKKEAQYFTLLLKEYSAFTDDRSSSVFRKGNLLSKEDARRIVDKNEPLYREIAQQFLGREDGRLFYGDYEANQSDYEFCIEDLTRITSFLLLKIKERVDNLGSRLKDDK